MLGYQQIQQILKLCLYCKNTNIRPFNIYIIDH
jgi:hypothetical protein